MTMNSVYEPLTIKATENQFRAALKTFGRTQYFQLTKCELSNVVETHLNDLWRAAVQAEYYAPEVAWYDANPNQWIDDADCYERDEIQERIDRNYLAEYMQDLREIPLLIGLVVMPTEGPLWDQVKRAVLSVVGLDRPEFNL